MQGPARQAQDFPLSLGIVFAVDHNTVLPRALPFHVTLISWAHPV